MRCGGEGSEGQSRERVEKVAIEIARSKSPVLYLDLDVLVVRSGKNPKDRRRSSESLGFYNGVGTNG